MGDWMRRIPVFGFGGLPKGLSLTLSLLMVASPGSVLAMTDASTPTTPGSISVASDPPGAAVYVDGQFAGQTPLTLDRVAGGELVFADGQRFG